jgi:hypothetical protein
MKIRLNILSLLVFLLLSGVQANSQVLHYLMKTDMTLIESKWETDTQGVQCLNYYNADFCDYIRLQENEVKVLKPGKNTVYKKTESELENAYKYGKSYRLYRGRFITKKFDPYFVYALPYKKGAKVRWTIDRREPKRTLLMQCQSCDTVYAVRSGVVCTHKNDKSTILMYHNDYTFAGYMNLSSCFVSAGEHVTTGDPIGIARSEGMSLTIFFLDENLFEDGRTIVHPYTHLMPVFRTDKGDVRLEEKTIYTSAIDADLITKEMGKAEKKRYLKTGQK